MRDSQRRRRLMWLTGAVVALIVLAGSVSSLQLGPGEPLPVASLLSMLFPTGSYSSSPQFVGVTRALLVLIFWIITPIVIVALIVSRELRRSFFRRLPIYIIFAVLLYMVLRWLRDRAIGSQEEATPGQQAPVPEVPFGDPGSFPEPPAFVSSPPQWLVILITLIIVALIGTIVWWIWSRNRARVQPTALERLTHEAQTALDDLRAGADVRDTVLRCYADMSRVLRESRGIQRGAGVTAREFEQQLRAVGLNDEHIERLTRLFERVRYGGATTSVRDAREAEACLFALVQTYGKVFG